ncbi:MAG TPA: hypothetical protein VGI40_13920 [Pirellulaceae bacterium]|jgi:hypothetical protein
MAAFSLRGSTAALAAALGVSPRSHAPRGNVSIDALRRSSSKHDLAAAILILLFTSPLFAQTQPPANLLVPPKVNTAAPTAATASPAPALSTGDSRSNLKVTKGQGVLPNDFGQVWREYDISPYTLRVRDVTKPEQAVIDWVLRETGTEVWFSEPLGILSANSTTLKVYHTPEMHDRVRGIVERFVSGDTEAHALSIRLLTVGSPNWRVRALSLLKPVDVKSPGVEAWLLSRENSAALYEQLKTRADFREHSAPRVDIANGQSQTIARRDSKPYTRGVQLRKDFPFYDLVPGKIEEGYSLQVSPLMSLDGQTMEAAITCSVDQIEKLVPLAIDVPIGGQSQRVQIQVPQMVSWQLSERFRWPTNEVLLLSCGVVATPAQGSNSMFSAFTTPFGIGGNRADALLMIEHRPPPVTGAPPPASTSAAAANAQAKTIPPIAIPAPGASLGTPTGSANSMSRGRY